MSHTAQKIFGVLAFAIVCAACRVDVNVNVAMQPDGSGVVTITAVADAAVLKQAPDLASDLRFDDVKAAGWSLTGPVAEADGGLRIVLTQTFSTPAQATQILANVSGADGPLHGITLDRKRSGGLTTFRLDGRLQVLGDLSTYSDEDLLAAVGAAPYATELASAQVMPADAVGINFTATLPGTVRNTTGSEQTGVLSWIVPADGTAVDVASVAEVRDPTNSWAGPLATGAMIAFLVWLTVSVVFIAYVLVVNVRRAGQRPSP